MKYLFYMIAMLMLAPVSVGNPNLAEEVPKAIKLMEGMKWSEAHVKLSNIVDQFGARGEALFAHRFGEIYYLKGTCELRLARASEDEAVKKEYFQMASNSMKECFEINMRADKVHGKSLLYRAQAEQELGNPANAIELNLLFKSLQRD